MNDYDNEQVIADLFEITQLIQTLNLPHIELMVEDFYVPVDLDKQHDSEEQLIDKTLMNNFLIKWSRLLTLCK